MLLKIIALGFAYERNAYLRDNWNILDMTIVIFAFLELILNNSDISAFKVLRLLRTLRPLRFITHNPNMKIVVNSLLNSFKGICNVIIVITIIWLMFAILGVALFGGKFYTCEEASIKTQDTCESYGHQWINADANFDNVIEAMLSLFVLSSLSNWPVIMYNGIDATEVGVAPEKDSNPICAYYFVIFIVIASFFFINLIIGTMFESYQIARDKEHQLAVLSILTDEQRKWFEVMELINYSKPKVIINQVPSNWLRRIFYKICTHSYFETGILMCIIANMLQMAILYEDAPPDYVETLETINLVLTCIFIWEAVTKLIGLGIKKYFANNWNKFDFFVVVTSILEFILNAFSGSDVSLLRTGPQLARIFRVFRVTKILRLVKSLKDIESILTTIQYSLGAMVNVVSLMLLIFFVYAVLGVFVFHDISEGNYINDNTNFFNFGNAMLILLRLSTGEDWEGIMFDYKRHSYMSAYLYFTSFQLITTYVMLNLFIMVLLQGLEQHYENPNSILDVYNSMVKRFKQTWKIYSFDGKTIHQSVLVSFMYDLGTELGVDRETPRVEVIKIITSLNINTGKDGNILYCDMLFSVLKGVFKKFRNAKLDKDQADVLNKKEKTIKIKNKKGIEKSEGFFSAYSSFYTMKRVFHAWADLRDEIDVVINAKSSDLLTNAKPFIPRLKRKNFTLVNV